jgi:hypothetical protein
MPEGPVPLAWAASFRRCYNVVTRRAQGLPFIAVAFLLPALPNTIDATTAVATLSLFATHAVTLLKRLDILGRHAH